MYAIAFFLFVAIALVARERSVRRECGFIGTETLNGRRMICVLRRGHKGPHVVRWEAAPQCGVSVMAPGRYDVAHSEDERRAA